MLSIVLNALFRVKKSPDEWATTKQACRDEFVVYLSFPPTIYTSLYSYVFTKVKILHCTSMSKVQNDDGEETQVRYTRHFLKWRCSCYICGYFRYIQGLREGEIRRRKGFICLKKNTALCAHSFFDGLAKVKLGF